MNSPNCIKHSNGTKYWYLGGRFHREDGPAIEYVNGAKMWFIHGKCHREDGPAIEYTDGTKRWWLDDEQYETEESYWQELFKRGKITEKELFLKLL
jgi:hypothetical protein